MGYTAHKTKRNHRAFAPHKEEATRKERNQKEKAAVR